MSYRNARYSSYYGDRWAPYVPVAERRRKAELEMKKLQKKGVPVSPVKIEGKKIATTFWGKAWCDNLEGYGDYENRLPRGRTYVRNGSVVDLQIAPREVTAMVSGSSIYKVKITIGEVAKPQWKAICAECSGGIDSLVELLQGRFSKGVMERMCRQGAGLFPKPAEIKFSCSCPDGAYMCKHVAAVLYGVGARLDAQPELLFRLRAVNEKDLVADIGSALPVSKKGPAAGKVLEADDMAALFGLDMGGDEAADGDVPVIAGNDAASASKTETVARKRNSPKLKAAVPEVAAAKQPAQVNVKPIAVKKAALKPGARRKPSAARKAVKAQIPAAKPVEWWKPGVLTKVAKTPVSVRKPASGKTKVKLVP
ncbi:MAG: hypothetical protein EXR07_10465 [Acetobacteraceae bacterium]|nr:hypothetical protein [Acetobacteraceae bacterium]